MARSDLVKCDYCEEEYRIDEAEEMHLVPGWLSVMIYDTMEEDVKNYDFCSLDCLNSHLA